jgi:hypothetical protein
MTPDSFYLESGRESMDLEQAPPWGKETVILDFCGGPYRFEGLSQTQAEALRQRYRHYLLSEDKGNGVLTQLCRVDDRHFRSIDTRGWTYERMEYHHAPDQVHVAGLKMQSCLILAPRLRGMLGTSLDGHQWFPGLVFENYFRMLTAYRLLSMGGAMLHSAGIVSGSKASLFLGHSGAGKSTLSELAHEHGLMVLSDDLNVLLPEDGQIRVEKVPFTGTFAQQPDERYSYPLGGVFKLLQGRENSLDELGPGAALSLLLSCAPFVNEDPYRFEQLADNLANIVQTTNTWNLTFNRDGNCFDLL